MNRTASGMLAATLSVSFAAADVLSANAASFYVPQAQSASSDVQTVEARYGDSQWIRRHSDRRYVNRNRVFSRNDGMY